ncbi:MAG TPA: hypothetical protein VJ843_03550 [Candidatus Saccharimonadales bacterium]|nr:hypothetical protein [Candidatus Saccharimonadales bacterium]
MNVAQTLAAASNMTPTSWVGLLVAFIGVVVMCFNGLRAQITGKPSLKLWVIGAILVVGGIVLAAQTGIHST